MKLQVIVGGQYGSEAKGHVAGYLASLEHEPLCIRVAGPNAGHSVVHPTTGKKYALRQIPVGAVTNPEALLAIAAGSEIDPYVLAEEIAWLENDGIQIRDRLLIDPAATWLTQAHKDREAASTITARIGSTSKGIGAARAERLMRTAVTVGQRRAEFERFGKIGSVRTAAATTLHSNGTVQVEGTQGYGLGLHEQDYPYATSSDCTALDFLAMARINPWWVPNRLLQVWIVVRPYPIRVAGNSGPLKNESTWQELGLEPELTTVTKKVRRVGRWDPDLVARAIDANGGGTLDLRLALTMADQLDPAISGSTKILDLSHSRSVFLFLNNMYTDLGRHPDLVTTSDRTVIDRRPYDEINPTL